MIYLEIILSKPRQQSGEGAGFQVGNQNFLRAVFFCEQGFCRKITASRRAFHCGRPAGARPFACNEKI